MKANENKLDQKFDNDRKSVLEDFDLSQAERVNLQPQKVNIDLPLWMIQGLDREASLLGIAREAMIKLWLANKIREQQSD